MEPEIIFNLKSLSHDSDILSLFNRHESVEEAPNIQEAANIDEQQNPIAFDLSINLESVEKGYYSDIQVDGKEQGRFKLRKPRQIINKKEKKRSKKRTRMYIQMLESRVEELRVELQKVNKLNKINKEYIQRLNDSEHMINGYFVGRQQLYEKLTYLLQSQEIQTKKISQQIASLRMRQGVFGKDRTKAVNYYFKEMVQMLLPEIQKYLVKAVQEEEDIFDEFYVKTGEFRGQLEPWRKKMLEEFDLTPQIREYFPSIKDKILEEKKVFDELLEKFYETKCQLTQKARKMQLIFDSMHRVMNPVQIARCLCYVDKYRFEKKLLIEQTAKSTFDKLKRQNNTYRIDNLFREEC